MICASQKKPVVLSVSLFNESAAIPFTRFFTVPMHPGINAACEFNYGKKERTHSRLYQNVSAGYFFHKHLMHGIFVSSEFGYEYRLKFGLSFTANIGLGYLHTFSTSKEYVFKDGKYNIKTDMGNSRLFPSISFDAGYYFLKKSRFNPRLFIKYQSWIEYPYSPGFIPVMTHINLHLGYSMQLNKKQP